MSWSSRGPELVDAVSASRCSPLSPSRDDDASLDDDEPAAVVEGDLPRLAGRSLPHDRALLVEQHDAGAACDAELAVGRERDRLDVAQPPARPGDAAAGGDVGRLNGRTDVEAIEDRVARAGRRRFGSRSVPAHDPLQRAHGFRGLPVGEQQRGLEQARARGPGGARVVLRDPPQFVERLAAPAGAPIDLGAVVERRRHGLAARKQPRHTIEAGQRGVEAGRRRIERQRRAAGDDVAHRRGVAGGVALHERLGRGARGRRVVEDVELILGNRQHRVVGDRRRRVAFGDRLEILQRLGITARAIELQTALELPPRLLLEIRLRLRQRRRRCRDHQPRCRPASRRRQHHRITSVRVCPAAIVTLADLPSPSGHLLSCTS